MGTQVPSSRWGEQAAAPRAGGSWWELEAWMSRRDGCPGEEQGWLWVVLARSSLGLDVAAGSLAQLCPQQGSASKPPSSIGASPNLSASSVPPDKATLAAR